MVGVRRTELSDAAGLGQILSENLTTLEERFGSFRLGTHVEHSSLCITAVDGPDEAPVGIASFFDYPRVAAERVPPGEWEEWFGERFSDLKSTPLHKCTWLSVLAGDAAGLEEMSRTLLKTMFSTLSQIDNCLICLPTSTPLWEPLNSLFTKLEPLYDVPFAVWCAHREHFVPALKIRLAQVEDHDDLIPVLNAQSDLHTDIHGEFFLASVIEGQDEDHKCIVAEAEGRAVGLIAVTTDVDIDLLNSCHDLTPWGCLGDKVEVPITPREPSEVEEEPVELELNQEEAEAEEQEEEPAEAEQSSRKGSMASRKGSVTAADGDLPAKSKRGSLAAEERKGSVGEVDGEQGKKGKSRRGSLNEVGDRKKSGAVGSRKPSLNPDQMAEAEGEGELIENLEEAEGGVDEDFEAELAEEQHIEPTTRTELIPNCFAITMFCLDKKYETRATDFLGPLFSVFGEHSNLQYCILTLPHTECESALMPLLTHIKPLGTSTFPHSLYIVHRDALTGPPSVRPSSLADLDPVNLLVESLSQEAQASTGALILEDLKGLNEGVRSYTLSNSSSKVIGVMGFDTSLSTDEVKSEFLLEDAVYLPEHSQPNQFATLRYLVLHPDQEIHAAATLSKAMRVAGISLVVAKSTRSSLPPAAIEHFVQLMPRKLIQRSANAECLHLGASGSGPNLDIDYADSCTMHVFAKRFMCEPKTVINARVVVVGASDTGLGFLESVLAVPYLHFSNLTLLTKDGLPTHQQVPFVPHSHAFAPGEIEKFGLEGKVNILEQRMTGLDRELKTIQLSSGSVLPYDYLVIAVGLQDQVGPKLQIEYPELASSIFSVNDSAQVKGLVSLLKNDAASQRAVVYGSGLGVYNATEALICSGVPADQVTIVLEMEPHNPMPGSEAYSTSGYFAQHRCSTQMKAILSELKITQLSGKIQNVVGGLDGELRQISLLDQNQTIVTINCGLLVTCSSPDIDIDAFTAVNSQSLIYDGALVVDGRFRTNDPTIFAGGPVVKHQRKLRATVQTRCYNSREVGNRLAACVLPVLDPASAFDLDEPIALAAYHKPKAAGAKVPGGNYVFVAQKPQMLSPKPPKIVSRELTTEGGGQYCRVTLDNYSHVCGLFQFGNEQVEHQNWLSIYGLPETVINRLASRYDEGIVHNMVSLLREEWAMALYHDRFPDLMALIADRLNDDPSVLQVQEHAKSELEKDEFKVDLKLRRLCEATPNHMKMWGRSEWLLKQFISDNRNHLPMYHVAYAPKPEE